MTLVDVIKTWLKDHNLRIISENDFHGWTCRDLPQHAVKGKSLYLSNRMHLAIGEDGFVEIAGSISTKAYKVHMSDPQLFPILDRALDEEDKWIRDGCRVPENELGDTHNRKAE